MNDFKEDLTEQNKLLGFSLIKTIDFGSINPELSGTPTLTCP